MAKHENFNLDLGNTRVDNVGAIFMTGNVTLNSHTKHVYMRYK